MRNNILRRTTALAAGGGHPRLPRRRARSRRRRNTGDVEVVNTETVQVYMTADGDIDTKRVYEQLALTGKGSVDLTNPIATDGLRNLDGFGDFEVEDGEQIVKTDVDGEKNLRSVSDFNGDLPLDIDVNYELDGKHREARRPRRRERRARGHLQRRERHRRAAGGHVPDGKGGTITKTVEVPIPMVGSLTTVAPENFTNVTSEQANMAGDGKGGTKLSFTMTLFPPVGSDTADVRLHRRHRRRRRPPRRTSRRCRSTRWRARPSRRPPTATRAAPTPAPS